MAIWSTGRRRTGARRAAVEGVDDPVRDGVRHPEQRPDLGHGQVGAPVCGHQQHPIGHVEGQLPARPAVGDGVPATLSDQADQPAELGGLQTGEWEDALGAG
jgi:hypothetical protein